MVQEGGERTSLYKQKVARNGLAKRTRRRAGVKLAFRHLLPGRQNADDPRTEPWSLGWLERLYHLLPETMRRADAPPRHNPAHSLGRQKMPELRKLLYPLVSPANPLSEPEARTKRDRKRITKEGR